MPGALYAWSPIYLEPYIPGALYAWSPIYLEPYMPGNLIRMDTRLGIILGPVSKQSSQCIDGWTDLCGYP